MVRVELKDPRASFVGRASDVISPFSSTTALIVSVSLLLVDAVGSRLGESPNSDASPVGDDLVCSILLFTTVTSFCKAGLSDRSLASPEECSSEPCRSVIVVRVRTG